MDELNKKLAEWAGFTWYDGPCSFEGCSGHCGWRYPDGTTIHPLGMRGLPNFTESLDACFKWLVPRLWICNISLEEAVFWSVKVSIPDFHGANKHGTGKALEESLPLALCLAIEKLIDGGDDGSKNKG